MLLLLLLFLLLFIVKLHHVDNWLIQDSYMLPVASASPSCSWRQWHMLQIYTQSNSQSINQSTSRVHLLMHKYIDEHAKTLALD